jgi:Putative zinc-finger
MATRNPTREAVIDKTCKQMTELVYDYLNDRLKPPVKRAFQLHLRVCPDCVSFLNTYSETVKATGSLRVKDMPPGVRDSLLGFLRRRMRQSGGKS